jgi:hypothetical protein
MVGPLPSSTGRVIITAFHLAVHPERFFIIFIDYFRVIIIIVVVFFRVRGWEAGVDVLWDRNMLRPLAFFQTGYVSSFQWSVLVKGATNEVGAVGKIWCSGTEGAQLGNTSLGRSRCSVEDRYTRVLIQRVERSL